MSVQIDYLNLFGIPLDKECVIALGLFVISMIIQIIYYLKYTKILFHVNKQPIKEKFPVSVIICARNEAVSLRKNLPVILEQDYPDFEVIVVNDCSEDDTEMVIAELRQKYKHLRSTNIVKDKKFTHGKKLALTIGIKSAQHEWLILTDADCKPVGKNWLYNFQRNFSYDTSIVLGYGGYRRRKGMLDKIIRFDTLFIAMQYLSKAISGKPYMGVGRNMAYRKSLFINSKGFAGHSHLLSGDDDLFINKVANAENTKVEIDKGSFTVSEPVNSWKNWFYQKKRHLTTFSHYKPKTRYSLGTELISRFMFYTCFVVLLIMNQILPLIFGIFGLRLILQLVVFKSIMKRLNEKYLLLISPIMDVLIPFINFIVIISNNLGSKNNRW